jgi:hypothetical protein
MDAFIEKLVVRQKDFKDKLIILGMIVAVLVLIPILLSIPSISSIVIIIIAGLVYITYRVIASKNIEFEYIVVNDDIDIDKIISKKKRSRIFSASCKDFEILAKLNGSHYDDNFKNIRNRIEAVSSMNSNDVYFAVLNYRGEKTIVFFEPDDRMLNVFKTYIPRKVIPD